MGQKSSCWREFSIDYTSQNAANTILTKKGNSKFLDELSNTFLNSFQSIQTFKIGGEYRLKDLSLRAGYIKRNNAQKNVIDSDQAITFGLGFNFGSNSMSLSFVQLNENKEFNMFSEGLNDPYTLSNTINRLCLSYNIKL